VGTSESSKDWVSTQTCHLNLPPGPASNDAILKIKWLGKSANREIHPQKRRMENSGRARQSGFATLTNLIFAERIQIQSRHVKGGST
jgi:hypothetical protein